MGESVAFPDTAGERFQTAIGDDIARARYHCLALQQPPQGGIPQCYPTAIKGRRPDARKALRINDFTRDRLLNQRGDGRKPPPLLHQPHHHRFGFADGQAAAAHVSPHNTSFTTWLTER